MKTKNKNNVSLYMLDTNGIVIVDGNKIIIKDIPTTSPLIYETPNRVFALLLAIEDIAKAYKVDPSHVAIKYHDMLRVIE